MKFVHVESFDVVGIEARTSFMREKEPGGVIPGLWERFMKEVHRGGEIIGLYTDYESDEYGEYTLTLGSRVAAGAAVPAGMVLKHVPASRYAVFASEPGDMPHIVIDTWKRIWREPRTADYQRSYRADFEVYGAADRPFEIYIGVIGE